MMMFIGDNFDRDIMPAHHANILPVHLLETEEGTLEKLVVNVQTLEELNGLIIGGITAK